MPNAKSKILGYLSSGAFSASQALLFVMYPILAERIGLSLSQIVLCFSAGSFLFLWGGPYWSMRSDWEGRGRILQIGQAGVVLTLLVLALLLSQLLVLGTTLSFFILLASRLLYGAVGSGLVPVAQALVSDESEAHVRTKAVTTHSMFLNMGRLLGPVLGLLLIGTAPMALVVLPLVFFVLLMPLTHKYIPSRRRAARAPFKMKHIWPEKKEAQSIFLLALLTTAFMGLFQPSLGAYIQDSLHFTAAEASKLMAKLLIAAATATVLVQFVIRSKLSNPWQGSLPLGAGGLFLGLLVILSGQGQLFLYGSVLLMSIGVALLTPSYTSAMSLHYADEQGKAAGGLSAAHTLGYALGGMISAFGLTLSSRTPFFLGLAVVLGIAFILRPVYRGRLAITAHAG